MSEQTVTFYQLEDYGSVEFWDPGTNKDRYVHCSFETERFGYYQCMYEEGERELRINFLKNEPDINVFSQKDQKYIEHCLAIVWRMVWECPADKQRFE